MSLQQITSDALKKGYSPEEVLESLSNLSPSRSEQVNSLKEKGYKPQEILDSFISLSQGEEKEEGAKQGFLPQAARGVLEGGLDLADTAQLAGMVIQAPINLASRGAESALVKALGLPSERRGEETEPTGQDAINRALADPNISDSDFIALASGDDDIAGAPIFPQKRQVGEEIRQQIPEGGLTQEIVRRGTRSVPFLAGGPAAYGRVLASELVGLAAKKGAAGIGVGETGQLVADIAGGLGSGVFALKVLRPIVKGATKLFPRLEGLLERGATEAGGVVPKIADKPPTRLAQAELRSRPKKIQNQINKLSEESIEGYATKTSDLAKNTFDQPGFSARSVEDSLIKDTKKGILRAVPETQQTSQSAWKSIAENVTEEFTKAKQKYRALYGAVERQAKDMTHLFSETTNEAGRLLKKLTKISTKTKGQFEVETALRNTRKDLGIPSMEETGLGVKQKNVPISNAISLKRALNDIINFENIAPSVKKLLLPVIRSLKSEILEGMSSRPLVKHAYNIAEGQYAKTAETYGRDIVKSLLKSDAPETVGAKAFAGSNMEQLNTALGKNVKGKSILEGQALNKIGSSASDAGEKILKEISPHISESGRDVGAKLVDMGDKLTSRGAAAAANEKLLDSIQKAVTTGERPEFALKMMKNPTGYRHVKDTLLSSPKGTKMFKALQKQHVDDVFESITTSRGEINWEKAGRIFKDPHAERVLKEAVGEEGHKFFKNLEKYGKNIRANMEQFLKKQPKSVVDEVTGSMGLHLKPTLASLVGKTGGLAAYLGLKFVPKLAKWSYARIISSPVLRKAFTSLANPSKWNGKNIFPVIQKLNEGLDENEEGA
jgi:hypothetical protein